MLTPVVTRQNSNASAFSDNAYRIWPLPKGNVVRIAAGTIALMFALAAFGQSSPHQPAREYPTALIREQQNLIVHGTAETWELKWTNPPQSHCGTNNAVVSLTCPCVGFAYGEIGDLYLVRIRDGAEIGRLRLTPFFTEEHGAAVQRWPADYDHDFDLLEKTDFPKVAESRPTVHLMRFADYDHDGMSTEFYLQTESLPCGKSAGIVVGVSKHIPQLHAFGTAAHPEKPLYLQKREWDALRDASKPVTVVDWRCGDHASPRQIELTLKWSAAGIEGVRREYDCKSYDVRGKLIGERPLSQ